MNIKTLLTSLVFLFISDVCFSQISVRDDSTKAYLNFSKNTTVILQLSRAYLETGDKNTLGTAAGFTLKTIDDVDITSEYMSDFMYEKTVEIANHSREIILNIDEHKMAVITQIRILEIMLDNYVKMIFLPETRKT